MSISKKSVGLALVIFLVGCSAPQVRQAQTRVALQVPVHQKAKPIQFRKVVVKLRRGQDIGEITVGLACIRNDDVIWKGGRVSWDTDELDEIFREELEKSNYEVVGDPDALFEDPSAWRAELLVAGLVKDMEVSLCYTNAGFGNWRDAKGGAFMTVNWQVYSRLDRSVVYETTTSGSYQTERVSPTAQDDVFYYAFAGAVNNLLADKGFFNLVTQTYELTSNPGAEFEQIYFDNDASLQVESLDINDARLSVVTVYAGGGHGSGFVIASEGLVLTNAHVVGGSKFVKLKLATGREILGEVVRVQKRRDVALIRTEESNLPALALAKSDPQIGSDMYAIGSPLDDEFSTTVSHGIVSGFRDRDGLKFIQSDVNVQPGSSGGPLINENGQVIGLAVSGRLGIAGEMAGINMFIPINDALAWLNLGSGETPDLASKTIARIDPNEASFLISTASTPGNVDPIIIKRIDGTNVTVTETSLLPTNMSHPVSSGLHEIVVSPSSNLQLEKKVTVEVEPGRKYYLGWHESEPAIWKEEAN